MKILTHNLLQCNVTGRLCKGPKFPLEIEPDTSVEGSSSETKEAWSHSPVDFEQEFLERLLPKLNWPALRAAALSINMQGETVLIPQTPPFCQDSDASMVSFPEERVVPWSEEKTSKDGERWWKTLHRLLFEYELITGRLICSSCGHVFPVTDSIPNMLLREDEV